MKNLLYKELKLASHPTTFLFLAFALMLLIPSYPYYVAFFYTCLGVFFIFLSARGNKDIFFTACLPVRKRDLVKARCTFIAIVELAQIIVSVPFAVIGEKINPNPGGNPVGIEANVAFFGLIFLMFGLFNLSFLPSFYKTAYKLGKPLLFGGLAVGLFILVAEGSVQAIPALKAALDTTDPALMIRQIPILVAGILCFYGLTLLAYKKSVRNFEKVDL